MKNMTLKNAIKNEKVDLYSILHAAYLEQDKCKTALFLAGKFEEFRTADSLLEELRQEIKESFVRIGLKSFEALDLIAFYNFLEDNQGLELEKQEKFIKDSLNELTETERRTIELINALEEDSNDLFKIDGNYLDIYTKEDLIADVEVFNLDFNKLIRLRV